MARHTIRAIFMPLNIYTYEEIYEVVYIYRLFIGHGNIFLVF